MGLRSIVTTGAEKLLAGDVRQPIEWLIRARSDRSSHPFLLRREPSIPSWIKSNQSPTVVRTTDAQCSNKYRGAIPIVPGGTAWTVDPPTSFTTLEFELVDPNNTSRITATVTFDTGDDVVSDRATYRPPGDRGQEIVGFEFHAHSPAERARVELNFNLESIDYNSFLVEVSRRLPVKAGQRLKIEPEPWITPPVVNKDRDDRPHVFLISIDSLRYDYLDALGPLLDALGNEAVVPCEPRVQGTATQQSHGSMLTGTHPSVHGLAHDTIDAGLPTIAEVLAETQYRCSACVSSGNLSPGFGFGCGFHRYEHQEMDWETREFDARTIVDTAIEWLETDLENDHRVFQFLHVFDAHYPYTPAPPVSPETAIDFDLAERTFELAAELQDTQMEPLEVEETPLEKGDVERWKHDYRHSLTYVTTQLVRFVNALGRHGILDESLILVTGDHGEQFFENGFAFHNSLHDENIRPGMIVKPPADADFEVPGSPDTIDFLPTISRLVGADTPSTCSGQAWQISERDPTRLTERLTPSAYQIAVELGDEKAILTYSSNHPEKPTNKQVENGPISREYYKLDGSTPRERRIESPTKTDEAKFLNIANEHLTAPRRNRVEAAKTVSKSVENRLSELGYK